MNLDVEEQISMLRFSIGLLKGIIESLEEQIHELATEAGLDEAYMGVPPSPPRLRLLKKGEVDGDSEE